MYKIAKLSDSDRRELFQETAVAKKITPFIAEKDFWVVYILSKIFTIDAFKDKFLFKGGTSLSKVHNLIERFSEDIDLVIDWTELTEEDPLEDRSNKKQDRLIDEMRAKTVKYIATSVIPLLGEEIKGLCELKIDEKDDQAVIIKYPNVYTDDYNRPEVKLEIGPRGAWLPSSDYEIRSYASEAFPKQFTTPVCSVMAIEAKRTFWEKITILHQEANRQEEPKQLRYSRHYYDIYKMADTAVKQQALEDIKLLHDVIKYKEKFFRQAWAKYSEAIPGTLKLIPSENNMKVLKQDYARMRNMIYGDYPTFEEIIETLQKLESEINRLVNI